MSKLLLGVIVAVLIIGAGIFTYAKTRVNNQIFSPTQSPSLSQSSPSNSGSQSLEKIIAEDLDTPWAIAFLPDGNMLVTERPGRVRLLDSQGKLQDKPVLTLKSVKEIGEGGLLGIAIDPNFQSNNLIYLYYTYSGNGLNTLNKVVSMKYEKDSLSDEKTILDDIPGSSNHNGGRIKFGPDGFLYITTGDAENPSRSQDKTSLAGKILRIGVHGESIEGNPFAGAVGFHGGMAPQIYSLGHRNPQGLAWDKDGYLWETEHGPSGGSLGTGNDEINIIEYGKNYGWPVIQGNQTKEGMITPVHNSTPSTAWAPGDIAVLGNSLFFSGLKGQALYKATFEGNNITDFKENLKNKYGRIREVILGPDQMLYITTSNQDGRGKPNSGDDKIIKIDPSQL